MTSLEEPSREASSTRSEPVRIITTGAILTAIAATLLVGSEAFAAALAMVWALTGLFHISGIASFIILASALLLSGYATFQIGRMAWGTETDPNFQTR